jgi:DNA-binding XRE family transcriptional regulator
VNKTKLHEMRIKKQISQEDMANLVGMNQSTYSRKERGAAHVTTQEWKILAQVLEVSVEDIFQDSKSKFLPGKSEHQYLSVPNIIMEELGFLKKENLELKEEIKLLKLELKNNNSDSNFKE